MEIQLRKGTLEDSEFLFNLRNEEAVRRSSFSSDSIGLEEHQNWLKKKLDGNDSVLFIAEENYRPIAQVRFDWINDNEAQINVAVTEKFRGRGYGSGVIGLGSQKFFKESPNCINIHAFIKPDNEASIRSFGRVGYKFQVESEYQGKPCVEMILTR